LDLSGLEKGNVYEKKSPELEGSSNARKGTCAQRRKEKNNGVGRNVPGRRTSARVFRQKKKRDPVRQEDQTRTARQKGNFKNQKSEEAVTVGGRGVSGGSEL